MDTTRPLPIVITGHVDHGKSTLIGRLLNDTGTLPEGRVDQIKRDCQRRGVPFEWSFVMDALQVERDQGITLDTTRIWFNSVERSYVIIDAPGHEQFLRNMITGAASADAAVLVVDAKEGVSEQTRRHAYLLHLLGVHQVIVAINKMDAVNHAEGTFDEVAAEIRAYLNRLGLPVLNVLPIAAKTGANVVAPALEMNWWHGPTLLDALDGLQARTAPVDTPVRFPVQDVYRVDDRRVLVGRLESGRLKVGDELRFEPIGRNAKVTKIESWNQVAPIAVQAGQSIAISLDRDLFVERGAIAVDPATPAERASRIAARLFWLDERPLAAGDAITLKLNTARYTVTVEQVHRVIDPETLDHKPAEALHANQIADVELRCRMPITFDPVDDQPRTGRGVLVRDHRVVGGCVVLHEAEQERNLAEVPASVTAAEVAGSNGHKGAVFWLTGLSGAGKSALAMAVRRRLFERGRQAFVLDGDNLRFGLNRDLGFSPDERAENIRRTAEVAKLMADSGQIVIVGLISPMRADRAHARGIVGDDFHEIYVDADLATCEARDPKGLYAKARAGHIREFTGIDAPYEPPIEAELVIPTGQLSLMSSLDLLDDFIEQKVAISRRTTHRIDSAR